MKASLDTNVIIHFYQAGLQNILFEVFQDGLFIYEQIRNVELEHHGKSILIEFDEDINNGKIEVYTDEKLKELKVYKMFELTVKENRQLYGTGDLGEVYAISLAQILGSYSLVTDDTKHGGPYMSLLNLDYDVMPFNFADVLILRYLSGAVDEYQTVVDFDKVNQASDMNWSFKSQLVKFFKRFIKDPYKQEEKKWIEKWAADNNVDIIAAFKRISKIL